MAMHSSVQTMLGGLAGNDTPERRERVLADAHIRCVVYGGKLSAHTAAAVLELNTFISEGREYDKMTGEKAADRNPDLLELLSY